ncbi:hypothetical protein CR513_57854, partial [Mucuna pruriens]
MAKDKVVILGPNELPNLYICTTLKKRKKLSHIEGSGLPRDDPKGRIFKFFHGLNSEYDPIHVQILGKEKLLSLSDVFSIVRSEETRRSVMLDEGKCFTKRSTSEGKSFTKSSRGEYCTYCKRPGHTKDTYYKFYGKEKELTMERTIGVAKEQGGLYYL